MHLRACKRSSSTHPQNKPVNPKTKNKKHQKLPIKSLGTQPKLGEFNLHWWWQSRWHTYPPLALSPKKQQTKQEFLWNKWTHFRDAESKKKKKKLFTFLISYVLIIKESRRLNEQRELKVNFLNFKTHFQWKQALL